jgi:hypothetical protein
LGRDHGLVRTEDGFFSSFIRRVTASEENVVPGLPQRTCQRLRRKKRVVNPITADAHGG